MDKQIESLLDNYDRRKMTRRQLVASLMAISGAAALPATTAAQGPRPASLGRSMNHLSLSVSDVNRSADRKSVV